MYPATAAWAVKLLLTTLFPPDFGNTNTVLNDASGRDSLVLHIHTLQLHSVPSVCLDYVVFPLQSAALAQQRYLASSWQPGDIAPVQGKLLQHVPSHAHRTRGPVSSR